MPQILLKIVAVVGMFLVIAYYILLRMTAKNEWGGYFQERESLERSSYMFTSGLN
jgi:hypothetical protein